MVFLMFVTGGQPVRGGAGHQRRAARECGPAADRQRRDAGRRSRRRAGKPVAQVVALKE
jgi:hypothetical protein